MTFLQALYGSQYHEINNRGGDASKGRINANLLLSALIILGILFVVTLAVTMFDLSLAPNSSSISGKALGRLLAIPLLGVCYVVSSNTVGTIEKYEQYAQEFTEFSEQEQNKANARILLPIVVLMFLNLLLVVFV